MRDTVPTDQRDIIDRLNDLLERGVSAVADGIITDGIAEIERLRGQVAEWVSHGIDDIDALDLNGLRRLLTGITERVDDLIAEREHESAVTAFELGFTAGSRRIDGPVNGAELGSAS